MTPRSLEVLAALQLQGWGPARVRTWLAGGQAPCLTQSAWERARSLEKACQAQGIGCCCLGQPGYPALLAQIPDPPPLLFWRGRLEVLSLASCAVVGTRRASSRGLRAASLIARALVQHRWVVVSGLARGIDRAAHQGALDAGGLTVAVLAHGLDQVQPRSHWDLAQRILQSGGSWVSEHPPGNGLHPSQFVRRNRIQSGLALATVVVESGQRGGAMQTAQACRRQGRLLAAVVAPGFANPGASDLCQDFGALALGRSSDLLQALERFEPPPTGQGASLWRSAFEEPSADGF